MGAPRSRADYRRMHLAFRRTFNRKPHHRPRHAPGATGKLASWTPAHRTSLPIPNTLRHSRP